MHAAEWTAQTPPEILVFGAGAIGALTSAYLTRGGIPVSLIDPWFQSVETIRRSGLHVRRIDDEFISQPRAIHIDEMGLIERPIDLLILALKAYDTEWATRLVAPYLAEGAVVLSAQNGMNEDRIARIVGPERVLGCVVAMSGFLGATGEVIGTTRLSGNALLLGELGGPRGSRPDQLAALLAPLGRIMVVDDIWAALWSKLLLNVMLNALAGITGLMTDAIWKDRRMVALMVQLGGEAILVAEGQGRSAANLTPRETPTGLSPTPDAIKAAYLGDDAAFEEIVRAYAAMAAGRTGGEEGKASLLQDIIRGRRTEIDYLNGYVVAEGRRLGIDTPANVAISDMVHEAELGKLTPGVHHAEGLLREFAPRTPTTG
jgi:2-dehydropantoate 2-reductase